MHLNLVHLLICSALLLNIGLCSSQDTSTYKAAQEDTLQERFQSLDPDRFRPLPVEAHNSALGLQGLSDNSLTTLSRLPGRHLESLNVVTKDLQSGVETRLNLSELFQTMTVEEQDGVLAGFDNPVTSADSHKFHLQTTSPEAILESPAFPRSSICKVYVDFPFGSFTCTGTLSKYILVSVTSVR